MASIGWTQVRHRGIADGTRSAGHGRQLLASVRRVPWRGVVHWVVLGGALGYLVWRIPDMAGQFARATEHVEHVRWELVGVAALCSVGGLLMYGELHRQLLLVGDAHVPVTTVQSINFAQNAVSATVPVVGGTGSLGYAVDQLRRRGVSVTVATWSVLMTGVITSVTLLVLGSLGLAWAGRIPFSVAIPISLVLAFGCSGAWLLLSHPAVLHRGRHRAGRPGHGPSWPWLHRAESAVRHIADQVATLQPSGARWAALIGVAIVSWILDFMTLVASAAATDTRVRLTALLVGFLVVQVSIALQVLPGGAGLAEAGLLGVLLGAGVSPAAAAATALIYRAISWLGLSVFGWVTYALAPHATHKNHDVAPESSAMPIVHQLAADATSSAGSLAA